ncbi:uncharacterized protein LOC108105744 [Drosophila eugracilis]|uniref:uncharacterized protein LOC108105744 n=1 Tax=Drosophila eugracilis TaxID=29029 RepID=UPI001BDA8102|nr:uncharacterized protein LOC108105744 [Drosophila eugracilis]
MVIEAKQTLKNVKASKGGIFQQAPKWKISHGLGRKMSLIDLGQKLKYDKKYKPGEEDQTLWLETKGQIIAVQKKHIKNFRMDMDNFFKTNTRIVPLISWQKPKNSNDASLEMTKESDNENVLEMEIVAKAPNDSKDKIIIGQTVKDQKNPPAKRRAMLKDILSPDIVKPVHKLALDTINKTSRKSLSSMGNRIHKPKYGENRFKSLHNRKSIREEHDCDDLTLCDFNITPRNDPKFNVKEDNLTYSANENNLSCNSENLGVIEEIYDNTLNDIEPDHPDNSLDQFLANFSFPLDDEKPIDLNILDEQEAMQLEVEELCSNEIECLLIEDQHRRITVFPNQEKYSYIEGQLSKTEQLVNPDAMEEIDYKTLEDLEPEKPDNSLDQWFSNPNFNLDDEEPKDLSRIYNGDAMPLEDEKPIACEPKSIIGSQNQEKNMYIQKKKCKIEQLVSPDRIEEIDDKTLKEKPDNSLEQSFSTISITLDCEEPKDLSRIDGEAAMPLEEEELSSKEIECFSETHERKSSIGPPNQEKYPYIQAKPLEKIAIVDPCLHNSDRFTRLSPREYNDNDDLYSEVQPMEKRNKKRVSFEEDKSLVEEIESNDSTQQIRNRDYWLISINPLYFLLPNVFYFLIYSYYYNYYIQPKPKTFWENVWLTLTFQ